MKDVIEFSNAESSADYEAARKLTLADMVAARQIYSSLGFKKIDPYYPNPIPGTHFMALDLHSTENAD